MIRGRSALPLAVWVALGSVVTVLAVLGSVALVLALDGPAALALVVGLLVGLALALAGVVGSSRVTAGLRALRADAMHRLRDPDARTLIGLPRTVARGSAELVELSRLLDALQLRARVADEVAAQARLTAEQASAGMFELLSGLVAAEEATRGQLSAELHDTVAQSLGATRALLAGEGGSANGQPSAGLMARVRDLVEDAEEQVRALMARTRPAQLRDGDLASAVGALRRDFAARYLFDVRVSWPQEPHPLPLVTAITVYRFYQEALLNVVKHANVDDADIALGVEGNQLVATVTDAGPGFVPGEVQATGGRHVGLALLAERARLAGGSLEIASKPEKGTMLTLRLPLTVPAGAASIQTSAST